jgi:hypothetical protein
MFEGQGSGFILKISVFSCFAGFKSSMIKSELGLIDRLKLPTQWLIKPTNLIGFLIPINSL